LLKITPGYFNRISSLGRELYQEVYVWRALVICVAALCSCVGSSDVQLASGGLVLDVQPVTLQTGKNLPSHGPRTELCIKVGTSFDDSDTRGVLHEIQTEASSSYMQRLSSKAEENAVCR
jgi:hypothetical protein